MAGDDLAQSLKAVLDHDRRRRKPKAGSVPVVKGSKPKPKSPKRGRGADTMSATDRQMVEQLITSETRGHGDYRPVDFKLVEVVQDGKVKAKTARVLRNLGGTPIERWHARGVLAERQMAAIMFYQRAWNMHIGQPRVVANWSAVICGSAQGAIEIYAGTRIAAKESLRLLDQEVFFRLPVEHFQVFQNVVIWDEPAGVAGGRAGFCHKPAEAVARVIVGTVASMIADIVIDASHRDFEPQLLDLDQPRRAGRGTKR